LCILLVDDGRPMAKTLTDILDIKGFGPEAVCFPTEVLERTDEGRLDCVPTDIKMPEVDGVVLLCSGPSRPSGLSYPWCS
jgi:FixJ family two-component response regulator